MAKRATTEQQSAPAYGIIDPDYARYYSIIRCTAWQYGYAIGMHGSFTRDLDLIAVPWAEPACDPDKLVRVICGRTDLTQHHKNPTTKPYGRLVFTLMLPAPSDPRWIDLSIMPRTPANDNTAPTHQPAPQTSGKEGAKPLTRCAANRDGECGHAQCPQLRDNEPRATGRHCPLDIREEEG